MILVLEQVDFETQNVLTDIEMNKNWKSKRQANQQIEFLLACSFLIVLPVFTLHFILPASPAPDPRFIDAINANPALQPTKEFRDNLSYLIGIASAALLGLYIWKTRINLVNLSRSIAISFLTVILFFSIANTRRLDLRLRNLNPGYYFEGVPLKEAVAGLIVSVLVLTSLRVTKKLRIPIEFLLIGLGIVTTLSFVQTNYTNADITNSQFVINELLSTVAGRLPLLDFVSQYSPGLPYFTWIAHYLTGADPYTSVFLVITLLNLFIVGSFVVVARFLSDNYFSKAWVFFFLVSAAGFTTKAGASPVGYLQGTPIRTITFSLLTVTIVLSGKFGAELQWWKLVGLIAPIAILINPEFGSAVIIGLVLAYSLSKGLPNSIKGRLVCLGWISTPSILLLVLLFTIQKFTNSTCDLTCGTEFIFMFGGSGYFSVPMQTLGFHQIVFLIFLLSLIFGISCTRKAQTQNTISNWTITKNELLIASATYGLFTYPYFVNRSYATLLVQYFPTLVLCTLLVGSTLLSNGLILRRKSLIVAGVAISSLFGFITFHRPPIASTLENLFSPRSETNFRSTSEVADLQNFIPEITKKHLVGQREIGLISPNMFPDSITNDIVVALPYNSPSSIVLKIQVSRSCEFLKKSKLKFIIVDARSNAEAIEMILKCAEFGYQSSFHQLRLYERLD